MRVLVGELHLVTAMDSATAVMASVVELASLSPMTGTTIANIQITRVLRTHVVQVAPTVMQSMLTGLLKILVSSPPSLLVGV